MPLIWAETLIWAELAWLGDAVERGVLIEIDGDRFGAVTPGVEQPPPDARRLAGVTVPGLANVHSHAFHRALRGRTHAGKGSFWTWREQMYAVATRLTPDSYLDLARAVYGEMALAGVTAVGEFHYLHHDTGGARYADPNAMSAALVQAAAEAGIRITLLDTCYLTGGVQRPLEGPQLRFGDGDAARWAERVQAFRPAGDHARVGAALHSVRGVPADQIPEVVAATGDAPLHVHLSEQRAENDGCLAAYGRTPTGVLADAGALGPATTTVHSTHLTAEDIGLLGGAGAGVCMCPTTERDLADGIGPARALADAGSPLSLGSDSHAVIDLFEEARAVELDERLRTEQRGHWTAAALLHAATVAGHAAIGWPHAGRIATGAPADLVTVGLDSIRLAGTRADTAAASLVFAATAADVRHVTVSGREVVRDGEHLLLGDVAARLSATIGAVLP
jgi:formiminoglutamate deiminase